MPVTSCEWLWQLWRPFSSLGTLCPAYFYLYTLQTPSLYRLQGSPCVVILPCKDPVKITGYHSNPSRTVVGTWNNCNIHREIPVHWTMEKEKKSWKSKQKHTLQGENLFSEQGFPCIGYNSFMFQLQNLKGCCDTL